MMSGAVTQEICAALAVAQAKAVVAETGASSIKLARCELVVKSTYVSKYPFSVQAVDKAYGCLRSRHQEVAHS